MINSTEIKFSKFFSNFKKSSKEVDMFLHIDMIVDGNVTVDVKGLKKLNRGDENVDVDIHWIEFQNVHGNKGWIYGEAEYIAFEVVDGFIMIKREELLEWCRKKIVDRKVGDKKEPYKLYRRKGRQDVISLVLVEDLLKLEHKKLTYTKNQNI